MNYVISNCDPSSLVSSHLSFCVMSVVVLLCFPTYDSVLLLQISIANDLFQTAELVSCIEVICQGGMPN